MIRQITAESDAKSVHPEKMHRETPGDNPILVEAKNNKLFDAEKWINCDYRFFKRVNPRMISEYDPIIKKMARRYGLDWRLVAAQIYTESCFKENAASGAGALGLMQIMPTTAKYLGFNENTLLNPEINIAIGCLYDQKMINAWGEQTKDYNRLGFALASYNSGRARVLRDYGRHDSLTTWQSVHPLLPEETQMYVHKIYLKHDLYRKNVLP